MIFGSMEGVVHKSKQSSKGGMEPSYASGIIIDLNTLTQMVHKLN